MTTFKEHENMKALKKDRWWQQSPDGKVKVEGSINLRSDF